MRRTAAAWALLGLTIAACGTAQGAANIGVRLEEWAITVSSDRYLEGPVSLEIRNEGEFGHTLVVEGPDGVVLAATDVIPSGGDTTLELDLVGTDFRFTCRIVTSLEDGTVVDHFAQGMVQTIHADTSE
jgi:hypothetical protein